MRALAFALSILVFTSDAAANPCALSESDQDRFQQEHLHGGPPIPGDMLVRRAYVVQYDDARRVPRWVSWRAKQDYLAKIPRSGAWKRFRTDPDVENPVTEDDYKGLQEEWDYARGHMVPYFMSGGDRNTDGNRGTIDYFDACTVFEINYMSNVAPQFHRRFNGAGGLWYELETRERKTILNAGHELHVIAGTIFAPDPEMVGPHHDIAVPDMYYRILVTAEGAVPFLFVHRRRLGAAGCELDARLEECIVTVAEIEALTGADFFSGLSDAEKYRIEQSDARAVWRFLIGDFGCAASHCR